MSTIDDLYPRAKHLVLTEGKASTSFIQRSLQIGYNAATALIERMEADGIVSAANHAGKREIIGPAATVAEICAEVRELTAQTADTPPWEGEAETQAAPKAEAPVLPNDGTVYTCSGCDIEVQGNAQHQPPGWYEQYSSTLGVMMHRCPDCAAKNAVQIATGKMTTEEIAAAGDDADTITAAAQGRLRTIVERCQRVMEDISGLRGDLKEVLDEAKGEGFDVKIIRKLLSELQKDPAKREEERELLELYAASIGERL